LDFSSEQIQNGLNKRFMDYVYKFKDILKEDAHLQGQIAFSQNTLYSKNVRLSKEDLKNLGNKLDKLKKLLKDKRNEWERFKIEIKNWEQEQNLLSQNYKVFKTYSFDDVLLKAKELKSLRG